MRITSTIEKNLIFILITFLLFPTIAFSQSVLLQTIGSTNWTEVSFADSSHGWMVGDSMLMRTTNGGKTWDTVNNLSGQFFSVNASGINTAWSCWLSSGYSFLGRTTDNGTTWDTLISFPNCCNSNFYLAHVKAQNTLYAWTVEGAMSPLADVIYAKKTTDGGKTWTNYLPSHSWPYFSFTSITLAPDSGVATIFARRYLYRSTDDGANWKSETLPKSCNGIAFGGKNQLWAVGDSGVIYHSAGYDIPFSAQPSGFTETFNAVVALDTQNVWVAGNGGTIARTTDGGTSWQKILIETSAKLNSICFVDANNGWIVGDSGIVICIRNDSLTSVQNQSSVLTSFRLLQNFPNPFNPNTKINYSIWQQSFVTLKVYDLLGREVATLVNEEKPAGEYEVDFIGSNLSSGVYFYQLQAGNFIETKKMILLQ